MCQKPSTQIPSCFSVVCLVDFTFAFYCFLELWAGGASTKVRVLLEDDAADIPVTNELAQNGKNYAC